MKDSTKPFPASSKQQTMQTKVAIIGGGLAGLHAAGLLHAAGIEFQLIEARNRLGGRILTADQTQPSSADGFDLGPSWFWPQSQPHLAALIHKLGLATFPQHSEGDIVFERMSHEAPARYSPTYQQPQSMRIAGGTGALVTALANQLPTNGLRIHTRVQHLALEDQNVTITMTKPDGSQDTLIAAQVLAALPPRLLAEISFAPSIYPATLHLWRETPTWMAPHAKFFAIYDSPFWRREGLSGTAQSFVGPLSEIHDATTASGKAALFGFLGVAAAARASIGEQALTSACLQQLARLFGPQARHPRTTLFKDWAADPLTASRDDQFPSGHPFPSSAAWVEGPWQRYLSLAGSETSPTEPGYMAGAIIAAEQAASGIIQRLAPTRKPSNP